MEESRLPFRFVTAHRCHSRDYPIEMMHLNVCAFIQLTDINLEYSINIQPELC